MNVDNLHLRLNQFDHLFGQVRNPGPRGCRERSKVSSEPRPGGCEQSVHNGQFSWWFDCVELVASL